LGGKELSGIGEKEKRKERASGSESVKKKKR